VGGGASGALNMWWDADIDAIMRRTKSRPIPAGKTSPGDALALGLALSGFSVVVLFLAAGPLAAGLLAFTIFFYAVIYTMWLKRSTPQNIVIGGAAGAFPPMIGWAAATGDIAIESVLMFALTFMWTPPHFWALALLKNDDYRKVGIPMMPVVAGEKNTRLQILIYSLVLSFFALLPFVMGGVGLFYGLAATGLSLIFTAMAAWLYIAPDERRAAAAKGLFAYSIIYLFLLFGSLPADRLFVN
jgi:protoheme IX farnesyltransferase